MGLPTDRPTDWSLLSLVCSGEVGVDDVERQVVKG